MKFFKHPFVTATGAAALVHSTWSLGTLFAGEQPEGWHLVGWLLPALLIAFALDVGQIDTSAQIREHGLTWQRAITFIVFAIATYYLQWLYIVHHMPALELSEGISAVHRATALQLRDLAMWLIPALLPLSTLLYTFSGKAEQRQAISEGVNLSVKAVDDEMNPPDSLSEPDMLALERPAPPAFTATCPDCGWESKEYETEDSAARSLRTHQSLHCEVLAEVQHADAE